MRRIGIGSAVTYFVVFRAAVVVVDAAQLAAGAGVRDAVGIIPVTSGAVFGTASPGGVVLWRDNISIRVLPNASRPSHRQSLFPSEHSCV